MYQSWVEIDLGQIRKNVNALRQAIPTEISILFVVKANAYGHGIVPISRAAAEAGIDWFAVAHLEEALRLRAVLPNVHLLVLGVLDPSDVGCAIQNRILPVIANRNHGEELAAEAKRLGITLKAHLKIDTGMGRIGVQWDEVESVGIAIKNASNIELTGVCSHFAAVDPDMPDAACEQTRKFNHALKFLPKNLFRHISSSRATLYFPEWDFDGIRPGIVLYGYGASDPGGRFYTRPILQWKTQIVQIKSVLANYSIGYLGTYKTDGPTRIATLAVGYADGYNRALSNCGDVLVHGRRCAVLGRVSMNWITIDLGPTLHAKIGDEVVLIGKQGNDTIWASELSALSRTIPYEILTSINASIERRYFNGEI